MAKKRILYFSFYFEPDLCAGSFRNSPLAMELSSQFPHGEIIIVTTQPNRYDSFKIKAPSFEERGNLKIHRIDIPTHKSGFKDQIKSFKTYFVESRKIVKNEEFDLVFASSSRLFTAYLGYRLARKNKAILYLDIRDIFVDTMKDVLTSKVLRTMTLPVLKYVEKKSFSNANHINLISGGFKTYFEKFPKPSYSNFPNGIDEIFLNVPKTKEIADKKVKTIVYAGNLGEGQGLHKIVPEAARRLGEKYKFLIIGDGGAKAKLVNAVNELALENVEFKDPIKRDELLEVYASADFLFMHLNDFDAFKKVLPSKVFELGAYDKPMIAGVGGFANSFVKQNIANVILFEPGDVDSFESQLKNYSYKIESRTEFIDSFKRSAVNSKMATSILSYLK